MRSRVNGCLREKNGIWQMEIYYYDENGKRETSSKTTSLPVKGNKRNAEDMLQERLLEYRENERQNVNGDMLFTDLMLEWLKYIKSHVRGNTYQSYVTNVTKRINPYFQRKKVKLRDLNAKVIQDYYDACLKIVSVNTVTKRHANIHSALDYAVRMNMVTHNPSDSTRLPKKKKFQSDCYTESELSILFEITVGTIIEAPVRLAALLGLRRSEVLGLTWKSIDFKNKMIFINNTCVLEKAKAVYSNKTKNESSNRILPLVPSMETYFIKLQEIQDENKKSYKGSYKNNDLVCKMEDGTPIKPDYLTRTFKRILESTEDIKTIRFHDLRHTSATLLMRKHHQLFDVKEWLGHSDISTTANLYAHYQLEDKEEMAESLGAIM